MLSYLYLSEGSKRWMDVLLLLTSILATKVVLLLLESYVFVVAVQEVSIALLLIVGALFSCLCSDRTAA